MFAQAELLPSRITVITMAPKAVPDATLRWLSHDEFIVHATETLRPPKRMTMEKAETMWELFYFFAKGTEHSADSRYRIDHETGLEQIRCYVPYP